MSSTLKWFRPGYECHLTTLYRTCRGHPSSARQGTLIIPTQGNVLSTSRRLCLNFLPPPFRLPGQASRFRIKMATPTTTPALTLPEIKSPLHLELRSVAVPSPPPSGSCNVRVLSSVLSANMPALFEGTAKYLAFPVPFVPGSSAIARVIETGPDATLLKPGDLVVVDSFVRSRDDPTTTQILMGLHSGYTEAQRKLMHRAWRDGLFKAVATVPLENAHRLDEATLAAPSGPLPYTPAELAISLPNLAVAWGGISAVGLKAGQTLLVGPATGRFSGAAVELATALGARVIALSRSGDKLARIRDTLASTYPSCPRVGTVTVTGDQAVDEAAVRALFPEGSPGADAFIDLSPGLAAQAAHTPVAFACLRPGGKTALMGGVFGDLQLNYHSIMFRSITIKGQWMYSKEEMGQLLRMVEAGVVKIGKAAGYEVRGEYALEDWKTAMESLNAPDAWGTGVVFAPTNES